MPVFAVGLGEGHDEGISPDHTPRECLRPQHRLGTQMQKGAGAAWGKEGGEVFLPLAWRSVCISKAMRAERQNLRRLEGLLSRREVRGRGGLRIPGGDIRCSDRRCDAPKALWSVS